MIRSCDQVRFYMSKFLYLFSSAIIGAIVSSLVWAMLFSFVAFLIKAKVGYLDFQLGFVGSSLEIKDILIVGGLIGIIFGIFIGLSIGYFNIDSFIKGGLYGFLTVAGIIISLYLIGAILNFFESISKGNLQQATESIELGNIIFFSIILFIPSFLSGAITAKLQPFILKMF